MKNASGEKKVAVIGLGKLGLPLSLAINSSGAHVVGFDLNVSRVAQLQKKEYEGPEPYVAEMLAKADGSLVFTDSIEAIEECSIAYVIVPTPSDSNGVFASNYVEDALLQIKNCWIKLDTEKVIVIVSTVMPGTTQHLKKKYFADVRGNGIELIYSPEFIALGSVIENLYNPDSILIGSDSEWATEKHLEICQSFVKTNPSIQILNTTEAELAKILVNTFVTMKISFANFVGEIATNVTGVNADRVARAVGADSRIGSKYLNPGLGFGGPCFPRDNLALIAYSRSVGLKADLAIATDEINIRQPEFFLERIKKSIGTESKIGILGLTYKKNSEVVEASQGILLANLLNSLGYEVFCFDNYIQERPVELHPNIRFSKRIVDLKESKVLLELVESEQNSICNAWQIPILKP